MTAALPFPEMTYTRIDEDTLFKTLATICNKLEAGQDDIAACVEEWTRLRSSYETMASLNHVHYTLDTRNEEVKKEKQFLDEQAPSVTEWNIRISHALIIHPQRAKLEEKYGRYFFDLLAISVETFDPKISEHKKKEATLRTAYTDLIASAKIEFQDETHNLSGLGKYMIDSDRSVRYGASKARYTFFHENADEFDRLYDELVKLRHEMATELGYKNYIELGYRNMSRTDYGPEDVARFREEIVKHVVPIAKRWKEEQRVTLGLDTLMVWDNAMMDKEGTPKPSGDMAEIVKQTATMYDELSPETSAFFRMMKERQLFDLETRSGKAGGGYCTSFPDFGVPFIFSNFNGTKGDIQVMTHECGHAFQNHNSRHHDLLEYRWPTYEACEIHSMGMEFLTYPWMNLFFGDDAKRFRILHMKEAIMFMPYGCAVDEFQHFVYENHDCTPAERRAFWKTLEEKYVPWRNYGDLPHVTEGGFWHGQAHIFQSPFYYIDYVLAQTCALQIWHKDQEDHERTFADYLDICKPGGSQSFLQLLKTGKLKNPFQSGVLTDVLEAAEKWVAMQVEECKQTEVK